MRLSSALFGAGALLALLTLSALTVRAAEPPGLAPLRFSIDSGSLLNRFVRAGPVAAHLVLRGGRRPRLLIACPAGDSGLAVWFRPLAQPMHWRVLLAPQPVMARDAQGRPLYGLAATLRSDVGALTVQQALLSSVRVLRDYEDGHSPPPQVLTAAQRTARTLRWARARLDGAAGFALSLRLSGGGRVVRGAGHAPLLRGSPGQALQLQVRALCGATPLSPLSAQQLLTSGARTDARERNVLAFLSYRQKLLAGSWRFDTYFGRDTLITLTLLLPVLQPAALEDGLQSVLARLSPTGQVAHEEAIGEYAILLNEAAGRGPSAAPLYDYPMIDEDFLLAPLAARWLADPRSGPDAAAFLARPTAGVPNGERLMRNLRLIVRRAAAFARAPRAAHLIGLQPGQRAGDWRDSPEGLDGGVYPYDVNVALVPAALAAVARLAASPLLAPYLTAADRDLGALARAQHAAWSRAAAPLFEVQRPAALARAAIARYAAALGVPAAAALQALAGQPVRFAALALDGAGHPLPIEHSDEAFTLLYDNPPADEVRQALATLMRPFPLGLLTPVGLLIANPVFAAASTQRRFTRAAYHGTVVWAWQQALLLAGLDQQLTRRDLPAALLQRLRAARAALWQVIQAGRAYRGSELWSWRVQSGRYQPAPFQPASGEAESDAAQLWSTVLLALPGP